jgi:hypothetical protein
METIISGGRSLLRCNDAVVRQHRHARFIAKRLQP